MTWRTVVISKRAKLDLRLNYMVVRGDTTRKIHIGEISTVIVESTIAPLSTDEQIKPIFEKAGFTIGKDLFLAHCPERVLPGQIMYELVNNNRIIGGVTPECAKKASEVYGQFVEGELILTEAKTAELSKCMENTFRDVNIALANELEIGRAHV